MNVETREMFLVGETIVFLAILLILVGFYFILAILYYCLVPVFITLLVFSVYAVVKYLLQKNTHRNLLDYLKNELKDVASEERTKEENNQSESDGREDHKQEDSWILHFL